MSKRLIETFSTIDEDGNRVVVTKVRNFQRVRKPDGADEEVERPPELHVDGDAVEPVEDDDSFRYRITTTGKKLRMP